ncbi:PREDICTED: rho GDP-dissociation inhibitor 1 isoform X1 [Mandrillus leucophaeus]|uniref:rho GDP-dissociation inhibitor 1 isoform X1 n=1 Tax=Mandrillus leucophaeus TaxID=9568 RepID=UPI0005F39EE9|nr:PREDICTED: rho GDP-dissociation inhibitor 1 isoform X1 [Mandrillus leucophaeus]
MAEQEPTAEQLAQIAAENEEDEHSVNYKPPAQKSIQEIQELDKDDESLRKYKEALLGRVAVSADPNVPNVVVTGLTLVCSSAPGPLELDLTGDLESFKKQSFVLKEGVEYRIKISFRVNREIVSGMKYIQHTYRKGVKIDKTDYMTTTRPTTCPGSGISPSRRTGRTEPSQRQAGQTDGRTTDRRMCPPSPSPPRTKVLTGPPCPSHPGPPPWPGSTECLRPPSSTLPRPQAQPPRWSCVSLLLLPVLWGKRGPSQASAALSVPPRFYLPVTPEAWLKEGAEQPFSRPRGCPKRVRLLLRGGAGVWDAGSCGGRAILQPCCSLASPFVAVSPV